MPNPQDIFFNIPANAVSLERGRAGSYKVYVFGYEGKVASIVVAKQDLDDQEFTDLGDNQKKSFATRSAGLCGTQF